MHDLTQEEFGKIGGSVVDGGVPVGENDRAVPEDGRSRTHLDALHVAKAEIIGGADETSRLPSIPSIAGAMASVPLRGKVHAGTPTGARGVR